MHTYVYIYMHTCIRTRRRTSSSSRTSRCYIYLSSIIYLSMHLPVYLSIYVYVYVYVYIYMRTNVKEADKFIIPHLKVIYGSIMYFVSLSFFSFYISIYLSPMCICIYMYLCKRTSRRRTSSSSRTSR